MRRILITLSGAATFLSFSVPNLLSSPSPQVLSSPFTVMQSPAPERSAEPHLTVAGNGRVLLSWLAPVGAAAAAAGQQPYALQFSELTQDRWSTPRTIVEGPRLLANWADFPTLFVTRSGMIAAHWLERRGQSRTAYDVKLRTARDGGRTWITEVTPHRDGTETEHGFVSFFETPEESRAGNGVARRS